MKIKMALGVVLALCCYGICSAVEIAQTISLSRGWNAVHVQIGITNDVNAVFRDWPVEWVALYDPAAFLDTKQYTADGTGEGVARSGYLMWRRAIPELSGFLRIPADSILVCYASDDFSRTYYGEPCAPRVTWHKSSKGERLNVVGFHVQPSTETTVERYFAGLDVGASQYYVFGGEDTTKPMLMPTTFAGLMTFGNAAVIAVSSEKISNWSGALHVSPRRGVDFGAEGTSASLDIRNDAPTNRVVEIRFASGDIPPDQAAQETIPGLYLRDRVDIVTNGSWKAVQAGDAPIRKVLAAGETWQLVFALDRSKLLNPKGSEYGELVVVDDVTPAEKGGSAMRVTVPLKATCDGGQTSEFAWPKGVWVAAAELDTVTFVLTQEGGEKAPGEGEKKAGGTMTVRLPLYVDGDGRMTLLQRLWYGRDTNGVLRAFSGAIDRADASIGPLMEVQRLSTPFLPTDQPQIAFAADGSEFGRSARVAFTVGAGSKVNPMRHALHPQHDGLTADYAEPAPSGDDFRNYGGTVKPETFSIVNRIGFTWDENGGTVWNPEETLTGNLVWEFDGLRHEGTVRARGRFVMRRLSPVTMKLK